LGLSPALQDGEDSIRPMAGDVLLAMDSGWRTLPAYVQAFQAVNRAGGTVVGVIYDLIPLTHPELIGSCRQSLRFARWLAALLGHSALLVGIAETTAQ